MPISATDLSLDLISKKSVSCEEDTGAIEFLSGVMETLGFKNDIVTFSAPNTYDVKNLYSEFKNGEGKFLKSQLTEKEYQDLCDFEGNANGFKILTESRVGREGGLRLSYSTLGAFMKYPKASLPKKPTPHIADKKYGFFQSEEDTFVAIAEELGLTLRDKEKVRL